MIFSFFYKLQRLISNYISLTSYWCTKITFKRKNALCICQKIYYSIWMKGYASFIRNVIFEKPKHYSHFHLKRKYKKIGIYEIGVRFETCLMESMSNVSIKTSLKGISCFPYSFDGSFVDTWLRLIMSPVIECYIW